MFTVARYCAPKIPLCLHFTCPAIVTLEPFPEYRAIRFVLFPDCQRVGLRSLPGTTSSIVATTRPPVTQAVLLTTISICFGLLAAEASAVSPTTDVSESTAMKRIVLNFFILITFSNGS